jgi:hypothetical protein
MRLIDKHLCAGVCKFTTSENIFSLVNYQRLLIKVSWRVSVNQFLETLIIHLLTQRQLLLVCVHGMNIIDRRNFNYFQLCIDGYTLLEIYLITDCIAFLSGVFIPKIKPVIATKLGFHTLGSLARVLEFSQAEHKFCQVLERLDVACYCRLTLVSNLKLFM